MKTFACTKCHNTVEVPRGITPTRCACNGELKPITKRELQAARLEAIKHDTSLTAARYDEIVALRMLLLDVVESMKEWDLFPSLERRRDRLVQRVEDRSATWGQEGDCV